MNEFLRYDAGHQHMAQTMHKKRVLISVGGTGGHIYPALALASQLEKKLPAIDILFVGGNLSRNRYFKSSEKPFQEISCGSFVRKNPLHLIKSSLNILKGIWQSRSLIRSFSPHLVVAFGSYYTFPTLIAAKLAKKQIILHEANSLPGKVNRMMARHVDVTGVHFRETMSLLPGPTVEVGMPLRDGHRLSTMSKEEARKHFGLDPHKTTLLVFGGSQGATSINTLFKEAVLNHLKGIPFQILQFTGNSTDTEQCARSYAQAGINAIVKDFETSMDIAWLAADLSLTRAGASSIAEQIEFEVPGVLIPFPRASENHQERNADLMVQLGGGIKLVEKELTADKLGTQLKSMLSNNLKKLSEMKALIKTHKDASKRIDLCSLVCELLEEVKG